MESNASHLAASSSAEDGRRDFLRDSLQDAQIEFSRLESPPKIIESALLTAMGALGTVCGFSGLLQPESGEAKVIERGLDAAAIAFVEKKFTSLVDRYAPVVGTVAYPFSSELHVLADASDTPGPLMAAKIRILIGWRTDRPSIGLMGLGANIKDTPFLDCEIEFLYRLVDRMLAEMRAGAASSMMHTLENALDQARRQAENANQRGQNIKKELEETRFRLSGVDDLLHELSGLQSSCQIIDTFLLVMLGIFSAQRGRLLYADDTARLTHATGRGADDHDRHTPFQPAVIGQTLDRLFASPRGARLPAMQAVIVPPEQLSVVGGFSTPNDIGLLFKVDVGARGVLCLGSRLVSTPYGNKDQELLLAFTHIFLAFLNNGRAFETIKRLNAEQEQKNQALEKTVRALSDSRITIAGLEKTAERIKAAIVGTMARTARVSVLDVALILLAGMVLGTIYNAASPSGIPIIPRVWRYPPSPQISVDRAKTLMDSGRLLVIDARPTEFYNQRHIDGALNLPLALFDFVYMMRFSRIDPQQPIIVYGRNISRHYDREVAYRLAQRGHANVSILDGGIEAWQKSGLALSP